ncbi:MAG: hypothetical protein H7A53_00280 [Akkermansiaceae bacterium]|nr:hypothetical protein [Akkermansiaceae bacterium]MCP5549321.1 hypothetical protein [Akkermansiaceae bacterium]
MRRYLLPRSPTARIVWVIGVMVLVWIGRCVVHSWRLDAVESLASATGGSISRYQWNEIARQFPNLFHKLSEKGVDWFDEVFALHLGAEPLPQRGRHCFDNLPKLRVVSVGCSNFNGRDMRSLASNSDISQLELYNVNWSAELFGEISKLQNLRRLTIMDHWSGRLKGDMFRQLESLPQLEELWIHSSSLGDSTLDSLPVFPKLIAVDFDFRITDEGFSSLLKHPALEHAHLGGAVLSNESVDYLTELFWVRA